MRETMLLGAGPLHVEGVEQGEEEEEARECSVCAVLHMLANRGLAQSCVAGTHPVWGIAPASSSGGVAQ